METGYVSVLKHGKTAEAQLNTMVVAAGNKIHQLPPKLRSRFHFKFHLRECTPREFEEVVTKTFTKRENTDPQLAQYIARKLAELGARDPRDAIGISRMAKTPEKADYYISILQKYGGI